MRMNLKQTKLVGLTMELELKTRDYKILCEKLEVLKQNKIDSNDSILLSLREEFIKNYNEIVEINRQIKEIENIEEKEETQEQDNHNELFKNRNNATTNSERLDMVVHTEKNNIFVKILEKIKEILSKK